MLKLMKYEFIHSMRTFFIAFAIFLLGCLVFPFFAKFQIFVNIPVISLVFGLGFSVLILGITIALFVSVFMNYTRSMFGRPAYLTMTLPVTTMQLILSKVIMSIVWLIIGTIILTGGIFLMGITIAILDNSLNLMELWGESGELIVRFMKYILTDPIALIRSLIMILSMLVFVVSTIYFSLTITHTKWLRKHRIIFGIGFYFLLNMLIEYVMGFIFGNNAIDVASIGVSVFYLVIDVLLVFGTVYVIDHHIEIE
ncbi:hypothetical protein [Candidatus Stoquefichus sp. SB1]|uniref:hypothetical protein n=1 Tax=Candidatus Stoquefichus sp. SB1 TaxID=1658109 RepID=UPI00067EF234|nr:hypothetical protein [Candidatus Stoquefichus sp. SB1]